MSSGKLARILSVTSPTFRAVFPPGRNRLYMEPRRKLNPRSAVIVTVARTLRPMKAPLNVPLIIREE
jgi:hypothetical protein